MSGELEDSRYDRAWAPVLELLFVLYCNAKLRQSLLGDYDPDDDDDEDDEDAVDDVDDVDAGSRPTSTVFSCWILTFSQMNMESS